MSSDDPNERRSASIGCAVVMVIVVAGLIFVLVVNTSS